MAGKGRSHRDIEHERLIRLGTDDHYKDTELYDFEYLDRDEDLDWYFEFAEQHRTSLPILELGAGSGRITCPLTSAGHTMVALDRMPQMLEALERRRDREGLPKERLKIVEGDMRTLPFPDASMGMVLSPFNALMHLYTWRDLLACFREVHRVLTPGGSFAFDVELPDIEWLDWDPEERHAITPFTHPQTGEKLIYSTNHTYDPDTQVCHVRLYYDDAPRAGRRFKPPATPRKLVHLAHREIFPEELRMLVDVAGFEMESHTGDFEGVSLGPGVQSQVVVCVKP